MTPMLLVWDLLAMADALVLDAVALLEDAVPELPETLFRPEHVVSLEPWVGMKPVAVENCPVLIEREIQ